MNEASPNALLWNVGGFGVVAVLYAAYALAIRGWFGSGWLFRLTVLQAVFIAAGASFNCDPGCPPVPQSGTMLGHMIAGLAYFVVTCVLPLAAWQTFNGRSEWTSYARPSLLVGLVGSWLAGVAGLARGSGRGRLHGRRPVVDPVQRAAPWSRAGRNRRPRPARVRDLDACDGDQAGDHGDDVRPPAYRPGVRRGRQKRRRLVTSRTARDPADVASAYGPAE